MFRIKNIDLKRSFQWRKRGITNVVLHHSAGVVCNISKEHSEKVLLEINAVHQRKDWGGGAKAPSIVYHFATDLRGGMWMLNKPKYFTWHAGKANPYTIGVVVLGNFEEYKPTEKEQANIKRSLGYLAMIFRWRYGVGIKDWMPHKSVSATKCCGKHLIDLFFNKGS